MRQFYGIVYRYFSIQRVGYRQSFTKSIITLRIFNWGNTIFAKHLVDVIKLLPKLKNINISIIFEEKEIEQKLKARLKQFYWILYHMQDT